MSIALVACVAETHTCSLLAHTCQAMAISQLHCAAAGCKTMPSQVPVLVCIRAMPAAAACFEFPAGNAPMHENKIIARPLQALYPSAGALLVHFPT